MLFLLMNLIYWTQTEASVGGCSGALVSICGDDIRELPIGEGFNLSCEFTCLRPQHVAQMWMDAGNQDRVSLVNITSILPNVMVVLNIRSATEADTGYYYCMTEPPDSISPHVLIQISDNLTSTPTTSSTPQCDSTQQHSNGAGLQGQLWYWMLLGKTTILLLSLAALLLKYKSR